MIKWLDDGTLLIHHAIMVKKTSQKVRCIIQEQGLWRLCLLFDISYCLNERKLSQLMGRE